MKIKIKISRKPVDYLKAIKYLEKRVKSIQNQKEDELLWIMRSNLGISDEQHMQLILNRFGEDIIKECPACHAMTPYYPEHGGWWCESCQNWV